MPTPILHAFTGYALYRSSKKKGEKRNWKLAFLCVVLANLADFDMLPGALLGKAAIFHRGFSHSLGAAVICGLIVATVFYLWKRTLFIHSFLLSSSVYFSHAVLDFLNAVDKSVPILWPFSSKMYGFQFSLYQPFAALFSPGRPITELGFQYVPALDR